MYKCETTKLKDIEGMKNDKECMYYKQQSKLQIRKRMEAWHLVQADLWLIKDCELANGYTIDKLRMSTCPTA